MKHNSGSSDSVSFVDNFIGWISVALILIAYVLMVLGVVYTISWPFMLLNLIGSMGVAYTSFRYKNYQVFVLCAIWLFIAAASFFRLVF